MLAADANSELSGSRYWLTLAGLLAVGLVLLAVYRSASRALVPLLPIALATGWSALVLEAIDIPLNPMSATLGALVIAVATEFSVILSARYHEEREAGRVDRRGAAVHVRAHRRAVLASGVTSIAGFGVLAFSGITMLRDFGLVTVVDLTVALAGVMLVLPAALVWAEEGFRPLPGDCGAAALVRGAAPARRRPRLSDGRRRRPGDRAGGWWPEDDEPEQRRRSRRRDGERGRRRPPRGLASPDRAASRAAATRCSSGSPSSP